MSPAPDTDGVPEAQLRPDMISQCESRRSKSDVAAGEMLGGVVRLLRMPSENRRRILEAVAQLTRASLELRLAPSQRTVALLGTLGADDPDEVVRPADLREAVLVGGAVASAARRL